MNCLNQESQQLQHWEYVKEECAPTLNAAAGMSGNNRPFIVAKKVGVV